MRVTKTAGFPPPAGFTQLIEVYRGVEIWYNPTSPRYWCKPTAGYESYEYTVQACRNYIDWVLGLPLSVTLSASPTSGPVPLTVNFMMTISGGVTPYTFTLNRGDGTPDASGSSATDPTATQSNHTYIKAGTFTVTFTVTDALGATAFGRAVAYAGVLPIPDIVSLISGLAPLIAVASVVAASELQKAHVFG